MAIRTGKLKRKAILLACLPKVPTSKGLKERREEKYQERVEQEKGRFARTSTKFQQVERKNSAENHEATSLLLTKNQGDTVFNIPII
ncbi:MAG: hypothetical protein HGB26_01120 [Desulfobulbaceae bacterium]|nr:hypothetical protein [Desulfobulbaceae bacterium]